VVCINRCQGAGPVVVASGGDIEIGFGERLLSGSDAMPLEEDYTKQ
jgi:hypothetical protein